MEEGILQRYVYTKEIQQNVDVFQDLSKILDYGMDAAKFRGFLSHRLSMRFTFGLMLMLIGTYKAYQLSSHNHPLQIITCQKLLKSLVNDSGYG